jgi:hypothetical protein
MRGLSSAMRGLMAVAATGLLLAGCMTDGDEKEVGNDVRYVCDASRVQNLVGQAATQALGAEAIRASRARTLRWIAPGQVVTMDYRTDRLNLHLDAQNRVTRVACG